MDDFMVNLINQLRSCSLCGGLNEHYDNLLEGILLICIDLQDGPYSSHDSRMNTTTNINQQAQFKSSQTSTSFWFSGFKQL